MFTLSETLHRIYDLAKEGRPLRIAMFTDVYVPQINGVVTSIKGLAKGLRELGHEVYIVAPQHPEAQEEDFVIRLRSTTYPAQPEQRMALPPSPRKIYQLSRYDFDIIHAHGINMPMIAWVLARSFSRPMILTYHTRMRDYIHYYPWYPTLSWFLDEARWYSQGSRVGFRLTRNLRRGLDVGTTAIAEQFDVWLGNRAHQVIAPAEPIAQELREMGVSRPIRIIHNGIDIQSLMGYRPDPFPDLGIPEGAPRLMTVSRLGKEKSVDVLLQYFKLITEQAPQARLVILGDGPERGHLEALAGDLGIADRVIFRGYVDPSRVADYYHHADLFIFASTSEVHPMVGLEAAACGLPIVARAKMGITRCVVDGKSGYLVDPGNPAAFREAVVELLQNPAKRAEFAEFSRIWAVQEWSHKRMAQHHIEAYQEAVLSLGRGELEDDPSGEDFRRIEAHFEPEGRR